ncbi:thioesterase II family protein [Micromonospora rosaria]|uniref:thioesterase II family protein n=1 Tax=Micromonospora rosaria TaxID=47874 RepID=UPI001B8024B8|nr:alpha/beta fold hydrolase [Micromonospora rosaria]
MPVSIVEKLPLVCFPHAGSGTLYYSKWKFAFSDGIDVRVVQYPLREQRTNTPMPASLPLLARDIFTELVDSFRGTFAIWGHSMGSIVGYEVAKLCQQRLDNPPLMFFTSGSAAPCDRGFQRVSDLDTPEGIKKVLRDYGGLTEENLADADFMNYFAPIIGGDLRLLGSYQDVAVEQLRCPIVVMKGRADRVVTDQWQRYTERPVETTEFDGGHFFIEERRPEIAAFMESKIQLMWQRKAASAR